MQESPTSSSPRVAAGAPRAAIAIVLKALALALVWGWGVRGPRSIAVMRGSTMADRLVTIAAIVILLGSFYLIITAMQHLGRHWAIEARTIEHHELVRTGPYRIVRHPIYLGIGGFMIAIGLLLAPLPVLIAACVIYILGTNVRIRAEDALMAATFGAAFEEYRRRVPALIPRFRQDVGGG